MLGVGQSFPDFRLTGVVENDLATAFKDFSLDSFAGKWKVVFFWPKDFTFVCPTEIVGFAKLSAQFEERNTQVIGASTDSEYVHLAWRQNNKDLSQIPFPMLSDIKRELSGALGIIDPKAGVAQRATYIVDPKNIIRFVTVNDLAVGRSPEEVLRVVEALQTGALCPVNWKPGEATL